MDPTEGFFWLLFLGFVFFLVITVTFLIVWLTQSCDSKGWLSWALLLVLLTASRQPPDGGDSPQKRLLTRGSHRSLGDAVIASFPNAFITE